MRYVQSLPPIVEPVPDNGAVRSVARTAAAHRVSERTMPPMVYQPRAEQPPVPAINRRTTPHAAGSDRRLFCRRVRNVEVLRELRSGSDRRRRNQRRSDLTTAVDERI